MHKLSALSAALLLAAASLSYAPRAAAATSQPLLQYQSALDAVRSPANIVFDYVVTRAAPKRVVTEKHRVYRNGNGDERNETNAVNGASIVPAVVQILKVPAWPYDVAKFRVSSDGYDARFEGTSIVNGRRAYAFAVTPKSGANFSITALFLDVQRHLPLREMFSVAGGGCAGHGWIDFGPAGQYWMPVAVTAMCSTAGAQTAPQPGTSPAPALAQYRESIHFSNYHFPAAIPADVFRLSAKPAPGGI